MQRYRVMPYSIVIVMLLVGETGRPCVAATMPAQPVAGAALPAALYEEWRKSPAPADGSVAQVNPPSLQWASVKHWENRDVLYRVELSDDAAFPADRTRRGEAQRWCFFNPHARLRPGKWYWRYEIQDGPTRTVKGPYAFDVRPDTPVFETPTFADFLAGVPQDHPRVITLGRNLAAIRESAATHPLADAIIKRGKKSAAAEIYNGPVSDDDPAKSRALERKASNEVRTFNGLIDGYVLSGDKTMLTSLVKRLEVLLKWPTNDLLGSQVLITLASAYDALQQELSPELRARMLAVIDQQLRKGLSAWPGRIEGRQVENHFWQMELSGNFTAALATVNDLDASREMLQYTYELFLARFPNLATPDGGWADGFGYFGVNESTVIDMALLLKRVGHVDVFKMQWYKSLPDYFTYFAPIGGRIDGFGDMHDRVGEGNIGQAMMLVIGEENQDARAMFRAASLMKTDRAIEPWYQIVNGITLDPASTTRPTNLAQDRMFGGVGLAALHTDVLDSLHDTVVYFRSSPFGAKGHMHANQNAFNLSRGGEPLFYSTGYYTSFSDAHSISSYRHTRAHNTILVNGCGQAFGHEGYGWIKRFASGKEISYVCGDATMAYRPTVDEQFLGMLAASKIAPTPQNGFGDGKLKLFERHVIFVRPDTVVIYDVLESQVASDWTLLLHTMKQPTLDQNGRLTLDTKKNAAYGLVTGSVPLQDSLTDRFYSPPKDSLNKYKETPNQFHLSFDSTVKTKTMRFLTILQMADSGAASPPVQTDGSGELTVGSIRIHAEMDAEKPACLSAESATSSLFINVWPKEAQGASLPAVTVPATLLVERQIGKTSVTVSENRPPQY